MTHLGRVYIVDEEYHFSAAVEAILRVEGYDTIRFPDATKAFHGLAYGQPLTANDRLLVDVALAPGSDEKLFSVDSTSEYIGTGLILVKELVKRRPDVVSLGKRMVLYSAHYTAPFWSEVESFCNKGGYSYWRKRSDVNPRDIVSLVAG
jgi:hypothetical protein